MARSGGRGAATTLFLRGAPSSQVLLLVDGVPQTRQDASGALSVEHLMLDQVDRVEVVRGNVSAIYGSGAIGGVIQVFTRRGSGAPRRDVTLRRRLLRLCASGRQRVGPVRRDAAGDRHCRASRASGFSAQDAAANPAVNPDRDGYRNGSGSASIAHEFAAGPHPGSGADAERRQARLRQRLRQRRRHADEPHQGLHRPPGEQQPVHRRLAEPAQRRLAARRQPVRRDRRVRLQQPVRLGQPVAELEQPLHAEPASGSSAPASNGSASRSTPTTASAACTSSRAASTRCFAGAQGQIGASSVQLNLRYDDVGGIGGQTDRLPRLRPAARAAVEAHAPARRARSTRRRWATCTRRTSATRRCSPRKRARTNSACSTRPTGQLLRATLFSEPRAQRVPVRLHDQRVREHREHRQPAAWNSRTPACSARPNSAPA